jgi:oligopeptidase B
MAQHLCETPRAVTEPLAPPQPPRRPQRLIAHGDERLDEWYGLRDADNAVIAYLRAENEYTEAQLGHTARLREQIFNEIVARVEETDISAPVPYGPFEYYDRTVEGLQYAIGCRRPRGGGPEQIVLDENVLAEGHEYFALGQAAVTRDHRLIAYTVDFTGDDRYALRVRDLETGNDLPVEIPNVYYGLAWYDDCRTLLYTRPDDALRPYQVRRHVLGTDPAQDEVVFEEADDRFFVSTSRERSGAVLVIGSESKLTSEWWFVPASDPSAKPRVIAPREDGHEYHVEHQRTASAERFLIVTNTDGARNFALHAAPADDPQRSRWETLVPARAETRLEAVTAFARFIVCSERRDGLPRLRVLPVGDAEDGASHEPYEIAFPDPVYTAWAGENAEYDTDLLRYGYSSLVQPLSDFDEDLTARTSTLVKQQPVRGGYHADRFVTTRLWAQASDGSAIPISVVHRHDVALDGTAPALLYGYGAYETSLDPVFRITRLPLLERGFVFAVAHVRGGGELGREWYEGGRLENKRNTFSDFIACAEHLVRAGYTSPERLVARGGSAGGLLMGAVANMRPDLFHAIVAQVPFVDVLTTMQDESLPLTVTEWEEWGNPADLETYRRMREYSPYDNVAPRPYPRMLVTTGLHDSAVQFWEPVKWTARLRANTTSTNPILLKTELDAGHHGPSGRYDAWREEAFVLAFVLDAVGIGAT